MDCENKKLSGTIVKLIGGIYFVDVSDSVYECTARGSFRNKGISPCCGDIVSIVQTGEGKGVIVEVSDRKNFIVRPPLANIDNLILVVSSCLPSPNLLLLDKFIAVAEYKNIDPIIVFTKTDITPADKLKKLYNDCGVEVFCISGGNEALADVLKQRISGQVSAFAGNTGVGKTTLLNGMFPDLKEKTAEISRKLGRGRHTTRHVSLYKLSGGGYVADTPGFSSFDTSQYDIIFKEDLAECFREFRPYLGKCRFLNCSHTKESGCAVLGAMAEGKICSSRHESYKAMYEEAKLIPEWKYKQYKKQ